MAVDRPNRVRKYRREADLTQKQLALQAGIHPAHLSDLERGRFTPSVTTATALARALGVPVEQLFLPTESGTPPDKSEAVAASTGASAGAGTQADDRFVDKSPAGVGDDRS